MRLQRSSIRSNIVKTSRVCEGHPLDRAAGGAPTPRGATVPREGSYSYDQFGARQSRPQENSWWIRVDLAFLCRWVGTSTRRREISSCTALSATSHGLGMPLGMTPFYPVQWGAAIRRTRLTTCACTDVLRFRFFFPLRFAKWFLEALPRRERIKNKQKHDIKCCKAKTRHKMLQFMQFVDFSWKAKTKSTSICPEK